MPSPTSSLCATPTFRRRGAARSALDAALVALAFGFVGAVTFAGTGPEPGPHAVAIAVE